MKVAGALAAALALAVAAAAPAIAAPARVGSTIRISGPTPFPAQCGGPGEPALGSEVEPHLAIDPSDPDRLLAAWQQDRHTLYGGARANVGAVSHDGGRTFAPVIFPGLTTCAGGPRDRVTDPWVSFGADGTAYASHLTFDYLEPFASADLAGPTQVVVQTSSDGGRTFGAPVTLVDAGIFDDRQALTADRRRPGRAYIVWTRRLGAFGETGTTEFSKTIDGGRTWTSHRTIYVPGPAQLTIPALIEVLPDGTLVAAMTVIEARYAVVGEPVPFRIISMRSTDDGATWSAPTRIGETLSTEPEDPDGRGGLRALPMLGIGVGPDGAIHAAWNTVLSASASEIRYARSDDGARTWTAPAPIARPAGQAFLPALAVAGDGTVGVLWDDTRNDRRGDGPFTADVWFAHSHDRGATWEETHVAGPFDALTAAPTSSTTVAGRFLGDYQGLAAGPEGFTALFPQARPAAPDSPSDTFVARLRTAAAPRSRAPRLHLTVSPRRIRAGAPARFRFQVLRDAGRRRVPVAGALVRLAGRRARTDRRGRATLTLRLRRPRLHLATATRSGFRRGTAGVRVLPAAGGGPEALTG